MEIEKFPPEPEPVVSDEGWIEALGWEAEDQQVLREYIRGGKLVRLPSKRKNDHGDRAGWRPFSSPTACTPSCEVNTVLKGAYAEDYVSLRRDLVDLGYLRRERGGGKYWLAPVEGEGG